MKDIPIIDAIGILCVTALAGLSLYLFKDPPAATLALTLVSNVITGVFAYMRGRSGAQQPVVNNSVNSTAG